MELLEDKVGDGWEGAVKVVGIVSCGNVLPIVVWNSQISTK